MSNKRTDYETAIRACYTLACIALALIVILCAAGPTSHAIVTDPDDPAETVNELFSFLDEGNYSAASALCLTPLPEAEPLAEEGAVGLYTLLEESWGGRISGNAVRLGDTASVPVTVTSLSLPKLLENMKPELNAVLAELVEDAELSSQVFDTDGNYRDEVVLSAWDRVLSGRMAHSEEYRQTVNLTIALQYSAGQWRIVPDEAFLNVLSGNA